MSSLLFSLVFISSGVAYHPYTDLSLSECVSRMVIERAAIEAVQQQFPSFEMKVFCKIQK